MIGGVVSLDKKGNKSHISRTLISTNSIARKAMASWKQMYPSFSLYNIRSVHNHVVIPNRVKLINFLYLF